MRRTPPSHHDVAGHVLSQAGSPVADARVSCGAIATRTDPTGAFRLFVPTMPAECTEAKLLAVAKGHAAVAIVSTSFDAEHRPLWPPEIELRLGTSTHAIRGRVLRANGEPIARARVWIADPTLFSHRTSETQRTSRLAGHRDELRVFWPQTVESLQGSGSVAATVADAQGRFLLEGLCARDYQLVAYDHSTCLRSQPTRVHAGADDVELRLSDKVIAKVDGRVVDRTGAPIAGIRVALRANLTRVHWGKRIVFGRQHVRRAMRTGPDGSFWLYDVPAEGVVIDFSGAGIEAGTAQPARHVAYVARRRTVVSVQCTDPRTCDTVGALDANGESLLLLRRHGDCEVRGQSVPIEGGRSEPFEVSDRAVVIVGYLDGREVRRTPVNSRLTTISW